MESVMNDTKMVTYDLCQLAKSGSLTRESLRKMVQGNVNINAKDWCTGWSAVRYATNYGRAQSIALLLEAKGDVNEICNDIGDTPLHLAAKQGRTECVRVLVQYGANVDASNDEGETPLHYAALRGHAECIVALLQSKANVNARNRDGETPAHATAIYNTCQNAYTADSTECLGLLMEFKANVQLRDKDGHTPLYYSNMTDPDEMDKLADDSTSFLHRNLPSPVLDLDAMRSQYSIEGILTQPSRWCEIISQVCSREPRPRTE